LPGTHPGLAVLVDAVGRARQIEPGTILAKTIDALTNTCETARGYLFEVDRSGNVIHDWLP
jgi:hypothetical protein